MKRKIFVALSAAVLIVSVAISIIAHCGSTWSALDPTFGPQLPNGCTASSNPTTTSKSIATTIYWTVGPPLPVVVTDNGQNKLLEGPIFGFPSECKRCFPEFDNPQWIDLGNGVTEWSQITRKQTITQDTNECVTHTAFPINHHYGRTCTVNQQTCEYEFSWFWNPFSDSCQEEGPPECNLLPELCENGQWSFEWCGCVGYPTPIVVDLNGNGFNLTDASHGVTFNANTIGGTEKLAWTSGSSDDAWLALDRNGNGAIDDGSELFGDATAQPDPLSGEKKNGFRALAEYDKLSNGGNADGQIESGDSVFPSLRLWRDSNHDGLSQPSELHTLPSQNVAAIELDYKLSKKTDNNGNQFSFRAKVKSSNGQQLGRWAWDVYLVKSQ
jgi:hypothetical protein